MGLDIRSTLNQGNPYINGFTESEIEKMIKQLEHFKSMMQSGLNKSAAGTLPRGMDEPGANHLHPGTIPLGTLNMAHAGGYFSSQRNFLNYTGGGGVTHEPLSAMDGGDWFGQQLRALQSSHPCEGFNHTSGFSGQFGSGGGSPYRNGSQLEISRSERQEAHFQSFVAGQAVNFPPDPTVPYGGGEANGNPTLDDMRQFFGMPRSFL